MDPSIHAPTNGCDLAIVGAGAAGLATAIFAARGARAARIWLLDGAPRPGAKILVSGGSRCNVTNARVDERDFHGGKATIVRRVLRAFPVPETVAWFRAMGVPLHEEGDGKMFPDTNRSRDVLDALLRTAEHAGVQVHAGTRVLSVQRDPPTGGFVIDTNRGRIAARRVVLATGGRSLPKTGSDGGGYAIAQSLGHTLVPTTPALVPLVLDPHCSIHSSLAGVSLPVELRVWIDGALAERISGPLLWTHFGVSGPAALDASRTWARARLEEREVAIQASFYPGTTFEELERTWLALARERPQVSLRALLSAALPDALAVAVLGAITLPPALPLGQLGRDGRRRLLHAVLEWPLPVLDTRGFNYAEVTAGGIELSEVDPSSMESRRCPGLYLVGEVLDVDGRLGGFNFQWAWASGKVAGAALARFASE